MLPKVATHLIHSTSRAATIVQNQTHTIRNVLQFQSSSGPTTGPTNLGPWNNGTSSSKGNSGPGSGGAKHNAGSRFHPGFAGPARTVTQASAVTSSDGTPNHEEEEVQPRRAVVSASKRRTRLRSHSVSLSIQAGQEQAESLGVLKTVQLHARSKHAFAQQSVQNLDPSVNEPESSSRAQRVRRNSTSLPLPSSEALERPPTPVAPRSRRNSTTSVPDSPSLRPASPVRPSTPPSTLQTAPDAPQTVRDPAESSEDFTALQNARASHNPSVVAEAVLNFRETVQSPSLREFNLALTAIYDTRQPGDSLNLLLETYSDLLNRSLLPNYTTYSILIQAFIARDQEVQQLIKFHRNRIARRALTGGLEGASRVDDEARIQALEAENNFPSAMSLFEAILTISPDAAARVYPQVYAGLLRSAAEHGSPTSAIHIFGQLESRSDLKLHALHYKYLLQAYSNASELSGAEEIFAEYKRGLASAKLSWSDAIRERRIHIQMYNQMIEAFFKCGHPEKAVALLEEMLASTAPVEFSAKHVPPPASSTFSTVLNGFISTGDLGSAMTWFQRLSEQGTYIPDTFTPLGGGQAMRPDSYAYSIMLDALALKNTPEALESLNKVYLSLKSERGLSMRPIDRTLVFNANMIAARSQEDEVRAFALLDFITSEVLDTEVADKHTSVHDSGLPRRRVRVEMMSQVCKEYINRGNASGALAALEGFVRDFQRSSHNMVAANKNDTFSNADAQHLVLAFQQAYFIACSGEPDLVSCIRLSQISDLAEIGVERAYLPQILHAYGIGRVEESAAEVLSKFVTRDWELLLLDAVRLNQAAPQPPHPEPFAFPGIPTLLEDMAKYNVKVTSFQPGLIEVTIKALLVSLGQENTAALLNGLGESFAGIAEGSPVFSKSVTDLAPPELSLSQDSPILVHEVPKPPRVTVNAHQTKSLEELLNHFTKRSPAQSPRQLALEAYRRYEAGLSRGKAPAPVAIGRLIQSLGRLGEMEKVRAVYTSSDEVVQSLESNKKWQSEAWFSIEDAMIIAHAHSGDIDGAHHFRIRILEQGAAPTADAYGALILYVKDTTDDASNALALFQESQSHGVQPNQYLFNNIISKLSKARKADHALELFEQMKNVHRIAPSSITYGAVIGACARVGDVQSAETLFEEMIQAKNFKPRVPPFNTMMQLYTTTKPNRERALFFYEELRSVGVQPTAHTYKLLMDAYGSIEPVDIGSMERVFDELRSSSVEIQTTHFASLINAYGCVQKDLDKALNIFASIPTYPRAQPADAIVFEAIFNVLVAHRRTDLLPEYVAKMGEAKVHMTAYVANVLIKGYSITGDLDQARGIFESLVDPPEGVAAPNNHAPHDPATVPMVDPMAPVYREPSTWEAMVRAELGAGNRTKALELLERLRARQYPEAVYNRISGIMVDHSMVLS
ncbi:hypothetical protein BDN72DRAFT_254116 [Pluteus cervinus]|uniref:Uncharacterized protein n=1 Tax=Pluteus cervinus TaxID=181527 RepID=A0ACD3AG49_9AGAR|nr:hypothetical protein BDN72DRAFT_254116 [Pluteus cervinus]